MTENDNTNTTNTNSTTSNSTTQQTEQISVDSCLPPATVGFKVPSGELRGKVNGSETDTRQVDIRRNTDK